MENDSKSKLSRFGEHFLKKILAGIAAIIPLVVTVFILKFVFKFADGFLSPIIERIYEKKIPGLGFILTVLLLYFLGLLAANVFGKKIIKQIEKMLLKVPIIKSVYNVVKQIVDSFSSTKQAFQRVVLVNFFGTELKSVGFVTGSSIDKSGNKWLHVFIPTAPNPTSGFLELVSENNIEETKLSVEEGLKMVLSGGVIAPEKIT